MDQKENVVWQGKGQSPFFGAVIPGTKYILFEDSIRTEQGIITKRIDTISLYRIAAQEIIFSPLGRIFNCGCLRLISRGRDIPNLCLYLKDPEKVSKLIEETAIKDKMRFNAQHHYNQHNQRSFR